MSPEKRVTEKSALRFLQSKFWRFQVRREILHLDFNDAIRPKVDDNTLIDRMSKMSSAPQKIILCPFRLIKINDQVR